MKLCTLRGVAPRAGKQARCARCTRVKIRESRMKLPQVRAVYEAKQAPCADCGRSFPPEVMELDHVRGEKRFGLDLRALATKGVGQVLRELAKCEVRCPTCHRLRHYEENWGPWQTPERA